MTSSRPLTSAGSAAAACAPVRKVCGLGVIETAIGRFTGLVGEVMRCIATDLDPAAVESADMDSRGMVVALPIIAHVGSGRWIVRPISLGAAAITGAGV